MPASASSSSAPAASAAPARDLRPRPRISYEPQYRPDGTSVNAARRRKELRGYDADEEEPAPPKKRKKGSGKRTGKGKGSAKGKGTHRDSDEENTEREHSGRRSGRTDSKRGMYAPPWRLDGKLYRSRGGQADEAYARIPLHKPDQARYNEQAAAAAAAAEAASDDDEEEASDAFSTLLLTESEASDDAAPQTPSPKKAKVLVPATPEAREAPWAKTKASAEQRRGQNAAQSPEGTPPRSAVNDPAADTDVELISGTSEDESDET